MKPLTGCLTKVYDTMKAKLKLAFIIALMALTGYSCGEVDDDRIPAMSVNVELSNPGYWDIYGVNGLGQYCTFIKSSLTFTKNGKSADFPFTAMTYTGFGGILLVTDLSGQPLAYDLACPVEVDPSVRVNYNLDTMEAKCPKCGSVYNVCEYNGSPVSGIAYDRKYGLRRYRALPASTGGYNIVF